MCVCVCVLALQGYDIDILCIPSVDEYICQYARLRSLNSVDNWNVYMSFVFFRTAAIAQGVYKRFTLGLSVCLSVCLSVLILTLIVLLMLIFYVEISLNENEKFNAANLLLSMLVY